MNATRHEFATRLRGLGDNTGAVDIAAIAMYPVVRSTNLRWIDLEEGRREDYRHGVRRVIGALADLVEGEAA